MPCAPCTCLLWQVRTRGFGSTCRADGDDGDVMGSRFWAGEHRPLGEAPISAPQAKKFLGPGGAILMILDEKLGSKFGRDGRVPQSPTEADRRLRAHSVGRSAISCGLLLLVMLRLVNATCQQHASRASSSHDRSAATQTRVHNAHASWS